MLDILLFLFNSYETENGIKIVSIGKLKDKKTFVVSGSYAYTGSTNDMNPPLMVCERLMNDFFFIRFDIRCQWKTVSSSLYW